MFVKHQSDSTGVQGSSEDCVCGCHGICGWFQGTCGGVSNRYLSTRVYCILRVNGSQVNEGAGGGS
jgi:hypothetical protein